MAIPPIVIQPPEVRHFTPGLQLVGVAGKAFGNPSINANYLNQDIMVQVPAGTKFIHVSVLSQDWAFGDLVTNRAPSQIASLTTEITVDHDASGKLAIDGHGFCTIHFKAALQDQATIPTSGPWGANFMLEIMCFG